jgi:hypothetical protein
VEEPFDIDAIGAAKKRFIFAAPGITLKCITYL